MNNPQTSSPQKSSPQKSSQQTNDPQTGRPQISHAQSSQAQAVVLAYRLGVLSRVLAATFGTYVVVALMSSLLAMALPWVPGVSKSDAVMIATMLSFAMYTGVALWVFCARSASRAWVVLGGVAFVAGAVILIPYGRGIIDGLI